MGLRYCGLSAAAMAAWLPKREMFTIFLFPFQVQAEKGRIEMRTQLLRIAVTAVLSGMLICGNLFGPGDVCTAKASDRQNVTDAVGRISGSGAVSTVTAESEKAFGDFTGLGPADLDKMNGYREIVVDASEFSAEDIAELHRRGSSVYSYLNIGSLETYRPYYSRFAGRTLRAYGGWSDERWMDVSDTGWQNYLVNTAAASLVSKGIDGFFLDNLDVYSISKTDPVFSGLTAILSGLKQKYGLRMISNGGYDFFTEALRQKIRLAELTDAVCAESVYTTVGAGSKLKINKSKDREYAVAYLNDLQANGLGIYIIEYTKSSSVARNIEAYYSGKDFTVYIAPGLSLGAPF